MVRDLIEVIPEWSSGFLYFLQFKSEFCNKEFMIWATVSSQFCFCWLYRASRKWQPTPVFLLGEFHRKRSLACCSPQGRKESDMTEQLSLTHSLTHRASPSLAAENIISLISVLTIWWCPCVESFLVLLEEGVSYDHCVLLAKLY